MDNDKRLNHAQRKFMKTFSQIGQSEYLASGHKKKFFDSLDAMMEKGKITHFFKEKFAISDSLLRFIFGDDQDKLDKPSHPPQ